MNLSCIRLMPYVLSSFLLASCGNRGAQNSNTAVYEQVDPIRNDDSSLLGVGVKPTLSRGNDMFPQVTTYRLFESNEREGYCYRTPSFVRSGKYVVVVAQKRFGFTPGKTATSKHKRPVIHSNEKIDNASSCADESFISIVARMAVVPRESKTQELDVSSLKWSSEVTLVDMTKFVDLAITPTSRYFEPALFDYWIRLKANRFSKSSGYSKADLFSQYLGNNFLKTSSPSEAQVASWLAAGENAKNLLNIRFGAQAAFGFHIEEQPYLGVAGVLAYPTEPHAPHNDYQLGETVLKQAAVRVNLHELWTRVTDSKGVPRTTAVSLDLVGDILTFKALFNSGVVRNSSLTVNRWTERPEIRTQINDFDAKYSEMRPVTQNLGVESEILPAKGVNGLIELARWYASIDNPLVQPLVENGSNALELEKNLDLDTWRRAAKSVYANEKWYPIKLIRTDDVSQLLDSAKWTYANLHSIHKKLGMATERVAQKPDPDQMRLAAVMSAYARMINSRVNASTRGLYAVPGKGTAEIREIVSRMFFKKGRFGPGNGLDLPDEKRIFLPIAGGFPASINYELEDVDTDHNDLQIKDGSERQVAIIGKSSVSGASKYGLIMTMRYFGMEVPKSVGDTFDLSTWTRDFSFSFDSGRNWSADSFVKPTYSNNPVSGSENLPKTKNSGFESSEVQGSIASIPGFYGKGRALVLHLHPQNNSMGIVQTKDGKTGVVKCLGDSPGDASKPGAGCDYRMKLQLVPGAVNENWDELPQTVSPEELARKAVDWQFGNTLTVYPGSAGYSAMSYIGRDDCTSAKVGLAYEGSSEGRLEYKGFNNGISVSFVKVKGGDFRHKTNCEKDRDSTSEADWNQK